jgi:hypothetical protein
MRNLVMALPGFQEAAARLGVHTFISGRLKDDSLKRHLTDVGQMEQELIYGERNSSDLIAFMKGGRLCQGGSRRLRGREVFRWSGQTAVVRCNNIVRTVAAEATLRGVAAAVSFGTRLCDSSHLASLNHVVLLAQIPPHGLTSLSAPAAPPPHPPPPPSHRPRQVPGARGQAAPAAVLPGHPPGEAGRHQGAAVGDCGGAGPRRHGHPHQPGLPQRGRHEAGAAGMCVCWGGG